MLAKENENYSFLNSDQKQIFILKANEQKPQNNLLIFLKPTNNNKNNSNSPKNNNINKINFNSFLSPNLSLNRTKNFSINKEKNDYNNLILNSNNNKSNKNDYNKIKEELENINIILNENYGKLKNFKDDLDKLKLDKSRKILEFKNNLSDKETLEEKYNYLINEIKNNKNFSNDIINIKGISYIKINYRDINSKNKEKYINDAIEILRKLNIKIKNFENNISKIYIDFFSCINNKIVNPEILINNLFNKIATTISNINGLSMPEFIINFLLRISMKINIITEKIENNIKYLENIYKERKKELENKINEINDRISYLEKRKKNLKEVKNNIKQNLEIFDTMNSPYCEKVINNSKFKNKDIIYNRIYSIMNNTDYFNKSKSNSKGKTINNINKDIKKYQLTKYLTNHSKNIIKNKKFQIFHNNEVSKSNIEISSPCTIKKESKFKTRIGFKDSPTTKTVSNIKEIKEFANILNYNSKFNIKKQKPYKFLCLTNNSNYSTIKTNISNRVLNLTERINDGLLSKKKRNMSKKEKNLKYNFLNFMPNLSLSNLKTSSSTENGNANYNKRRSKKIFNKINPKRISENNKISKSRVNKLNREIFILNSKQLNKIQTQKITTLKNSEKLNKLKKSFSKNHIMESFCYYKLFFDEFKPFNPINNNINELGYNEGFISIDNNKKCLRIKNKNILQKNYNNSFYTLSGNELESIFSLKHKDIHNNLNIDLKTMKNIYIDNIMKDIITIHNIFLKNSYNGMIKKNSIDINKILNKSDIIKIKNMEQNEKIKAGLCNFFAFIIELKNSLKIEFILINFFHFNVWFNYLQNIIGNNTKLNRLIQNGNNSYLIENKRNWIKQMKFNNVNEKCKLLKNCCSEKNFTRNFQSKFETFKE